MFRTTFPPFGGRPVQRRASEASACEALERRVLLAGTWNALTNAMPNNAAGVADGAQLMMLLSDGTVMVHGNVNTLAVAGGSPTAFSNTSSSAWYKLTPSGNDYIHGAWSTLASMHFPRKFFASNVMPSGKVFVVGGEYTLDNNNPPNETQSFLSSSEIYDPLSNTWTDAANFNTTGNSQFGDDPTEMLPDGRILAGYLNDSRTYLYSPSANSWTQTAQNKLRGDPSDEESWVTLPDGSILSYDVFGSTSTVGHAQRYVPSTGSWVDAGNLPFALTSAAQGSELGPAFLLPNGDAWFTGANGKTALYTPGTNSWRAGPALPNGDVATDDPGAMLPNGHVLIALSPPGTLNASGGYTFPGTTRVYEYDPTVANPTTANSYTNVTPSVSGFSLSANAYTTAMLVLPNGHVLMCNDSGTILEFTPTTGGFQDAWRPYIANITSVAFNIFHVTGNQLTGISEGAAYGDDNEMSSNYPIVQLIDSVGNVAYARTLNWSIGVAKGSTPQSFDFVLPSGWSPDVYLLTVIANGIPSGQVLNIQMGAATTANLSLQPYIFNSGLVEVLANGAIESIWNPGTFASVMISGDFGDDLIVLNANLGGRAIVVNGNAGNDVVRIEANGGQTLVNGDAGDDITDFSYTAHRLANITGSTSVNGGTGNDSIFAYDNANPNAATYVDTLVGLIGGGWGGSYPGPDLENTTLNTGTAADTVLVFSTNAGQHLFLNSAGGHDIVTVGRTNIGAAGIQGSVEVHNNPNYTSLSVDDTDDVTAQTGVIDNSGSFGILAGICAGLISWANNDVSDISVTCGAGADALTIRAVSKPLTIHNSDGADSVLMGNGTNGMQSILASVTLIAAFGKNQSLTLYNTPDTVGRATSVVRSSANGDYLITGLAPVLITARDFGSMAVQEGAGADSFAIGGSTTYGNYLPLTVNGNGGNDTFTLTAFDNWAELIYGPVTYPVTFDGGPGSNTLSMNDTGRTNTSYQFYADRFYSREPSGFGQGSDFHYDNMSSISLSCSSGNNSLAVYGTSSDISAGNQITIQLGGGNDAATLYPHDAQGNLTINGTLGIFGGAGTDSLLVDDTGSSAPINYTLGYAFGTTQIFGMGAGGFGAFNDFESVAVHAGAGNDTFTLAGASGAPLSPWLTLDGGDGNDSFTLNDQTETHAIIYRLTGGATPTLQRLNNATSFSYLLNIPDIEQVTINAGPQADEFDAIAAGASPAVAFNPGGGADTINVGSSATLTLDGSAIAGGSAPAVNVSSGSSVVFDASMHLRSLALGGNGSIAPDGNQVLVIDSLTMSTGSLDLADNDLILPGGLLGTWNGGSYSGMTGLITAGKIHSSSQSQQTRLGIATASQIKGISGSQTAIFDGQTVHPNDVLVKYTYAGDANLDGKINIDDYGRIDANVGQSGAVFGWYNGDFNFDGKINIDDYGLIDSVIGAQGPAL